MSTSNSSVHVKPDFSVRIVVCDHYLTKPTPGIDVIYSEFRGSDIKQVPVLRVFGTAPDGHKACLHVHGVFPYFYVPCPAPNPEPQFLYQIAASLDKALNIALKQATSANQHVYKISLVKGLPFYGFHNKEHLYLKIFMYSPNLIKQAVELCANGAILGQTFQPHESHLNFTLQFFIDFNLFGMSNIDLQSVKFRRSGLSQNSNEPVDGCEELRLKSESICYYEADCVASHIINRQRIGKGDGIENPGLEEVWNQEKERRKQLNVSMASKSLSQGRIDAEQTESHYKFEQMCILKLSGLDIDMIDKPAELQTNVDREYPAESLEGTQLLNAVDVSVHIPESTFETSLSDNMRKSMDETLIEDADTTLVDENLAMNCSFSLHYSQVQLDNDDLELVDLLQDLDEKPVEDDSVMATPADKEDADVESDDAEYSQVFHDDTILLDNIKSKDDSEESWNDSFWDGANIPQLDGTCDDDHVKKVRKRKMRPFKLGLARPKSKKKIDRQEMEILNQNIEEIDNDEDKVNISVRSKNKSNTESEVLPLSNLSDFNSDISEDEINASRETIDSISDLHFKKSIKKEFLSCTETFVENFGDDRDSYKNTHLGEAEMYDLIHKYEPVAGTSNVNTKKTEAHKSFNDSLNISYESTPEDNKGIKSFYDMSKIFDLSLEDSKLDDMDINPEANLVEEDQENLIINSQFHNQSPSLLKKVSQFDDNSHLPINCQVPDAIMSSTEECVTKIKIDDDILTDNTFRRSGTSIAVKDFKEIIKADSQFDDDSPLPINRSKPDRIMSSAEECQEKTQVDENGSQLVNAFEVELNPNLSIGIENQHKSEPSSQLDFRESSTISILSSRQTISGKILTPKFRAPSTCYIKSTLEKYNIPKLKHPDPYYSDHKDVGDKVEIGLLVLKLQSKLAKDQKPYENVIDTTSIEEWRQLMFLQTNEMTEATSKPEALKTLLAGNRQCLLEPVKRPPTTSDLKKWLMLIETNRGTQIVPKEADADEISKKIEDLDNSQAIGLIYEDELNNSVSLETKDDRANKTLNLNTSLQVTMQPDGSFLCFGNNECQKENSSIDAATVEVNFLTVMAIEVLASVRGDLHPDPTFDPIQAVFLTVTNECPPEHFLKRYHTEIIVVDEMPPPKLLDRCVFEANVSYVNNENEILDRVVELIKQHDPDIMCGYEIEMNSWGYVLERSQVLGLEIVKEVSRITEKNRQKRWRSDENDFEGRIIGRIMFNVWRLFRHELALSSYSFENCMYEILKERVPKYSHVKLYEWWCHESRILRWIPVEFYLTRLSGTVRMLEKLDIINRTSELARLFGLQWWEVLSRGSQFRVESLMLRAARPLNLVALSPTVKQRAAMKAPECLPLIFEPESRFYTDPVIVLDFQSLYPSMMIAYNYCFSTCIGRVQNINGDASYEFGAWRLRIPQAKLQTLVRNGLVNWSPVGVGFVKPSVRRGVLPALLRRILAARQAVKKGMKLQTDEAVKKAMHSRQLGLKLIANVTYGYTAANFSGRMPCVEVGDSVVSKGRETLERAIKLVKDSKRWNAKVVYGDTDSMFVLVPGGSRADAFRIGQEIADAVTADNPSPVALKLEKVYQPCILQTKKRYVGFMYESAEQDKPVYEAKGIETVRRDGCPAGVKLLQRSLCELFTHGDMSRVKRVVTAALSRLSDGRMPAPELLFTREYHGAAGYRPGASAPPNEIAKRLCARDRRSGPRPGQRVSWLVTAGAPAQPLLKLARTPEEITREPAPPHVAYYATRVLLPPLHRCLSLLGANVFKWWSELGYTRSTQYRSARGALARYMRARGGSGAGGHCKGRGGVALAARGARYSEDIALCDTICRSCTNNSQYSWCCNTECPVLWRARTARTQLTEARDVARESHEPLTLHY